jgi:hypothetical protein
MERLSEQWCGGIDMRLRIKTRLHIMRIHKFCRVPEKDAV